jgi:hypothetical protein
MSSLNDSKKLQKPLSSKKAPLPSLIPLKGGFFIFNYQKYRHEVFALQKTSKACSPTPISLPPQ